MQTEYFILVLAIAILSPVVTIFINNKLQNKTRADAADKNRTTKRGFIGTIAEAANSHIPWITSILLLSMLVVALLGPAKIDTDGLLSSIWKNVSLLLPLSIVGGSLIYPIVCLIVFAGEHGTKYLVLLLLLFYIAAAYFLAAW